METILQKKVSVIIPAYNVEEWLDDCINSVLMQTLRDIEIIVVNDGSTDNTQTIIDKYRKQYPDIIKAITNIHSGPSISRNLALEIARGQYISFIDADDQMAIDMLEKMYFVATEKNADLVLCGRQYVGAESGTYLPPVIENYTNIFSSPKLLSDTSSFVWDKLFKRKTIEDNNFRFNEEIHYAEDALFIYTFLFHANVVCSIQEPLYYYTVRRAGSITGAMDERMFHEIAACKAMAEFYKNVGYFKQFYSCLLWIVIGFWGRKFYSFYKYPDSKIIQAKFALEFIDFLDKYYHNQWKHYIRLYQTAGNKKRYKINIWKTKKSLVKLYIFTPSLIIRTVKEMRNLRAKIKKFFTKKELKKFLKGPSEPYYFKYIESRKTKQVIDNQILYIPNSGDNLACNPYYMLEEASNRGKYKILIGSKDPWEAKKVLVHNNINATPLKMDSALFQEALATSKYLITNYRLPTYFTKREEQILINTWHGTPLKYLGRHMRNGIKDLGNVQSQFIAADYLLYPNDFTRTRMMDAFMLNELYNNEVLVEGYPRNSAFYNNESSTEIRARLGLKDKKVFVYMPTWRGKSVSSTSKTNNLEIEMILMQLDALLDNDTVLYVKLHNLAKKQIKKYVHIRPFPENLEIYQFLNIADGLITDYSSVFFDFANARKEIILFTYDKEEYFSERGVYFDVDNLPFKEVSTVEELAEYLDTWKGFALTEEYLAFVEKFCGRDCKETPKRINDIIFSGAVRNRLNSSSKGYNIYFTPDMGVPNIAAECLRVKNEQSLFVFSAKSVSPAMETVLRLDCFSDLKYIVVQNEKILTLEERSEIEKSSKTGNYSKIAQEALTREICRMIPNTKIVKAVNLTTDSLFESITSYINSSLVDN